MRELRVVRRYKTRFFYLKVSLICLFASLFAWSFLEGSYRDLSLLSSALAVVLAGICLWVLVVSFPTPFSVSRKADDGLRAVLLTERIKTCLLIISLSSALFLLHLKADPPFPKTGIAILAAGYLWCVFISWPEQKRIWRESRKQAQKKGWRWRL